jgi:hypothetical protein
VDPAQYRVISRAVNKVGAVPVKSYSTKFENLPKFKWYTYEGSIRKLVARKHERDLLKGSVFGIKEIRGDKFYIVFPQDYHIDFTVTKRIGQTIISKSKLKRVAPKIDNSTPEGGRASKSVGIKGSKALIKTKEKSNWDATYFKPPGKVADELKSGIDLSNYQWRKIQDIYNLPKKNSTSIIHTFEKKSKAGFRYLRDSKGGKIVTVDGKVFSVRKEQFDIMLNISDVLPKNKWPEGTVTLGNMKQNLDHENQEKKNKILRIRESNKKKTEEARREKLRLERSERLKLAEEKKEERLRLARRLAGIKKPIKLNISPKTNEELASMVTKGKRSKEDEDLLSEDDLQTSLDSLKDLDLDASDLDEYDESDLEENDLEENDLEETDESDLEEEEDLRPEDRTIDSNESGKLMDSLDELVEQRHEETFNLNDGEDDPDFEESDEDPDEESDEDPDEESDEDLEESDEDPDEESDEDPDEDPEESDEESDEDPDEDPEESDEGSVYDEAGEEIGDGDEDADVKIADRELKKVNKNPDNPAGYVAEEGDVLEFKSDSTLKREFLLLDIYPLHSNNNITLYKVYDITNKPDEFHTVRIPKSTRNKIENMVKFIRKLNPKEYSKFFTGVEYMDRSKNPINS